MPINVQVHIREMTFKVVKETECGYWFVDDWDYEEFIRTRKIKGYKFLAGYRKPKWVSKITRKRYCHTSKTEAMTSFIARKKAQIRILTGQLEHVKDALALAEGKKDDIFDS